MLKKSMDTHSNRCLVKHRRKTPSRSLDVVAGTANKAVDASPSSTKRASQIRSISRS